MLEYILNEFGHCFGEIGHLSKPYHITLKPDVTPVVHPPRKVPISIRGKLKKELEHMVDLNIIIPVIEPTDWVNSLVVVGKPNGSLSEDMFRPERPQPGNQTSAQQSCQQLKISYHRWQEQNFLQSLMCQMHTGRFPWMKSHPNC